MTSTITLLHRRAAGGMEGVDQRAYFTDATSAKAFVREYIAANLYEVFVYSCEIAVLTTTGSELDLLANVQLVADDAVSFGIGKASVQVLDRERAVRYIEHDVYHDDSWEIAELVETAAGDALENLFFLDDYKLKWESDTRATLGDLVYAGKDAPPLFKKLELKVSLPELPARLMRPGEPPESDEWN